MEARVDEDQGKPDVVEHRFVDPCKSILDPIQGRALELPPALSFPFVIRLILVHPAGIVNRQFGPCKVLTTSKWIAGRGWAPDEVWPVTQPRSGACATWRREKYLGRPYAARHKVLSLRDSGQGRLVRDWVLHCRRQSRRGRSCGSGNSRRWVASLLPGRAQRHGARCRVRTCDPLRVKQVLYH